MRRRILYRKISYVKKRNLRTINSCMRILLALLIAVPVFAFISGRTAPALKEEAVYCLTSRMDGIIEEVVKKTVSGSGQSESLADRIADCLSEKFHNQDSVVIGTPIGNIVGSGLLYGQGPLIKTRILSSSRAEVECTNNEYEDSEGNTMNKAEIQIRVKIIFRGLFIKGNTEVIYSIIPTQYS